MAWGAIGVPADGPLPLGMDDEFVTEGGDDDDALAGIALAFWCMAKMTLQGNQLFSAASKRE